LTLPAPTRCVKVLLAMVPPLPPPPLLFGSKDNACFRNSNSSPTALVHIICQALKAHASLDRPLPAGPVGGKDGKDDGGNDNGNTGSGGQELDHAPDRDGLFLPPPSGGTTATREVSE
jgi:hypothetical protein